jgi:transcriptional regulator with XRE-family HTH domain
VDFAKALGVDRSTIVNWEANKTEPSASQLRTISELSGIPIDFIFVPMKS